LEGDREGKEIEMKVHKSEGLGENKGHRCEFEYYAILTYEIWMESPRKNLRCERIEEKRQRN